MVKFAMHWAQTNAVPVLSGLVLALVLANTIEDDYKYYFTSDVCPPNYNATAGSRRLLAGSCHLDRWKLFDCPIFGHSITLSFIANDIIMAFFFGLAMKEVVESLLPGGSLNPPSKAINPLMTTLGGVLGPVAVYFIFLQVAWELDWMGDYEGSSLADLQNGWGIVTATDIVLAWLVAKMVFGNGHPAIDYLLLLAVADDALGMVIIAIFYPDPNRSVKPLYLLITLAGMFSSYVMRKFYYRKEHAKGPGHIQGWQKYIGIGGVLSWCGFIKAHLHPALSLCVIVPFMPTAPHHTEEDEEHSEDLRNEQEEEQRLLAVALNEDDYATAASKKEHIAELDELIEKADKREEAGREMHEILDMVNATGGNFDDLSDDEQAKVIDDYIKQQENRAGTASALTMKLNHGYLFAAYKKVKVRDDHGVEHHQLSTLDDFEHSCKGYVDLGLFLFGFVNAGIVITGIRPMAILIPLSLLVGKFLGILVMYKIAFKFGARPPLGIHTKHICMIGLIASIGLVVAIFVSNVAFTDEKLQGDAKLGAILSAFPCPIIAGILTLFFKFDDAEGDIRQAAINELQSTNSGGNATNSDFRGTLEAVPRKVSKSKGKDGQTDDGIRLVEPGEAVEVSSPSDWGSCGAARACQAQHEVDAV